MLNKSQIAAAVGAAFLVGSVGLLHAADATSTTGTTNTDTSTTSTGTTTPTASRKAPLSQSITSVGRNLERYPDNKGLQNAYQRLERNQERYESRSLERADRVERAEKVERPERVERPEKVERPGRG